MPKNIINERKMSNAIKSVLILKNIETGKAETMEKSDLTAGKSETASIVRSAKAPAAAAGNIAKAAFKKAVKSALKKIWKIFKPFLRPVTNRITRKILELIENSYLASRVNESTAALNALSAKLKNLEEFRKSFPAGSILSASAVGAGAVEGGPGAVEGGAGAVEDIVVVGAGGHAKVAAEAVIAGGKYRIAGFIDPEKKGDVLPGIPVIGGDDMLYELYACAGGIKNAVLAVGDNALRQKIAEKIGEIGFQFPPIIHPNAFISPSAKIGMGAVVMQGAIIGSFAHIGDFAIINTGSIVEHDNIIGGFSHIAPGCSLAGSVKIGDRAFIGIGSSIIPGISIGNDAIVGAGSSVIRNISASAVVGGVPAKEIQKEIYKDIN